MFSIHPKDLEFRRKRCQPLVEKLAASIRTQNTGCNVCGSPSLIVLAHRDRYGFSVRTALCTACGLIYLADRLDRDEYSAMYADGKYRALAGRFSRSETTLEKIREDQTRYAAKVIRALEPHFELQRHYSLLDVGGSAGFVAATVASRFGCTATVLDPSVNELASARSVGLETIVGSLETYETGKRFEVILLCRSIEHLFDLRGSLSKLRDMLKPNGFLYCDIVDFIECCRCIGAPQAVTKLDHCYWLCQETATTIFQALGLEPVAVDVSCDFDSIGYLLRRCAPTGAPETSRAVVDNLVRRLREINSDWLHYGLVSRGMTDRLRSRAYRAKRQLLAVFQRSKVSPPNRVVPELVDNPAPAKSLRTI